MLKRLALLNVSKNLGIIFFIIASQVTPAYAQATDPSVYKTLIAPFYESCSTVDSSTTQNGTQQTSQASPSGCCSTAGSIAGGVSVSGSISPGVGKGMSKSTQEKFQQIMVAAGQKFDVNPNFIATFYYVEDGLAGGDSTNNADSSSPPPRTGDGNWKEPPPPYGHGPPYPPPNSFSATGPFQFINSTWAQYGVDGNGDGKADVTDLTDAAFGAAKYLAASGAKGTTNDADLRKAAFAYNQSTTYGDSVLNTFHYLTGKGSSSVSGESGGSVCSSSGSTGPGDISAYKNPLRSISGLTSERIDEGVDYCGSGSIYAVGTGKVTFVGSGWFSSYGPSVVYKLTDGPASGKYVYFSENINPRVHTGDTVTSDSVIADMISGRPCTETGWALNDSSDEPAAGPDYHNYQDGTAMAYGRNFSDFMKAIHGPAGNLSLSTNPSVNGGSLPHDWPPTWQ
jgi:hypothetical protein